MKYEKEWLLHGEATQWWGTCTGIGRVYASYCGTDGTTPWEIWTVGRCYLLVGFYISTILLTNVNQYQYFLLICINRKLYEYEKNCI